ncbi:MAG: metallophosphoesterase [Fervidicoccaceae archaeon]
MKILATSDAHIPKGEAELQKAVEASCGQGEEVDVLILAGDMIERGKIALYPRVKEILSKCKARITIGIFGNEEFDDLRDEIEKNNEWVLWLNDDVKDISINGEKILVFGSTGILDEPTIWQRKNIPSIEERYNARLRKLEEFLKIKFNGTKIAVFHYPPTYKTLYGEPSFAWHEMGSRRAEELIKKLGGVDLVIHGHAHRGKVLSVKIGEAEVYNVSLPARKDLFKYEFKKGKISLMDFLDEKI